MPTDIVMPQMGESIFEGTITKWLKKPGDKVQRDEPLFEISTDKVDAEIPAPASGVLQDIKVAEGATVQVNTVVGTISADGEGAAAKPAAPSAPAKKEAAPAKASAPATEPQAPAPAAQPQAAVSETSHEEDEHARSSPLVRKIARENNINLAQVSGTGLGGRITSEVRRVLLPHPFRLCQLHRPSRALHLLRRLRFPATWFPCRTCARSSPSA
jgi:pyruvate dehydrogenase E2 component (dihydrolipoamide acetyltransferase)